MLIYVTQTVTKFVLNVILINEKTISIPSAINKAPKIRGRINYILNPLKFGSLISTNKIAESIWRAKRNKN